MSKSERPGYASISLEVPIEVAEWFVANVDYLARAIAIAAARADLRNTKSVERKQKDREKRETEFYELGRRAYRLFRRYGGTSISKHRDIVQMVADELFPHDVQVIKLAIKKIKRISDKKIRARRDREIIRLSVGGLTNTEIAERLKIGRNAVGCYIKANKTAIWKYADEHPECYKALIKSNKGAVSGTSPKGSQGVRQKAKNVPGRRV